MTNPNEILRTIKTLPNCKASGPDEISNVLLKNLPKIQLSYFPSSSKHAKIIPIPKPGKDHTSPTSYRPISLLNTLSKLTEKIILVRLNEIRDRHNLLPDIQFGFGPQHATTHQIARLLTDIQTQNNLKKTTALCLLDLKKAYDRVCTDGLTFKPINMPFPRHITKLTHSHLTERTFSVSIQNKHSRDRQVLAGVSQGAVLCPTLFSLYLSDLPTFPE